MNSDYAKFIESKLNRGSDSGFNPLWIPDFLFDFQRAIVDWAIRKGRCAIFADCGLGKTPMSLVWATNVARKTNKPVLYLTPLAVGPQTIREAEKFGIDAVHSRDGTFSGPIVVTNYERLKYFTPSDFGGVVCDESSILKSFAGSRRTEITAFMRKVQYRLLETATAAPNDFVELGTSSEALGYMGHMDMLGKFFRNDQNNCAQTLFGRTATWRLKGHAEIPFWRWVCSWAIAVRKPSDLGFKDDGFVLPSLHEVEHLVEVNSSANGMLFALPAIGLKEQREERRRSIGDRCEKVSSLVNSTGQPAIVWCHLNDEGDLLEKSIPDSVQVSGKDSDDKKESGLESFAKGEKRVLVTKPKIGAWGLNFQHCNHVVFFPTHSYEQYYQAVRRCWRFGQKREVTVDIVTTEGELGIMKNLQRKSEQSDQMFSNLVGEMNNATSIVSKSNATKHMEIPAWL